MDGHAPVSTEPLLVTEGGEEAQSELGAEAEGEELTFASVLEEERLAIARKREARQYGADGGCGEQPFSIAFSGGGTEDAAFQAGVLWRLAQEGVIQNIEYFAAVSGGAYVAAAFASYVVAAGGRPDGRGNQEGEIERTWYLTVVGKTLCRMQRNIRFLMRETGSSPWSGPEDGSSLLPRIFDMPIFVCALFVAGLINFIGFVVLILVPFTEAIEVFFGATMREVFCRQGSRSTQGFFDVVGNMLVIEKLVPYKMLMRVLEILLAATFFCWIFASALKPARAGPSRERPKRVQCWLCMRGLTAALRCFAAFAALVLVIVGGATGTEIWAYRSQPQSLDYCSRYMSLDGQLVVGGGTRAGCGLEASNFSDSSGAQRPPLTIGRNTSTSSYVVVSAATLLCALAGALALMPFEPQLLYATVLLMGPALVLAFVGSVVQYRVFGPLTRQHLIRGVGLLPFDAASWTAFVRLSLRSTFLLIPIYHTMPSVVHWFYSRSLKLAFFEDGVDRFWYEMKGRRSPHCPFLLFTGTVNDYVRPGDELSTSDISFSALHTGGDTTGYVRSQNYQSLAKCTALTGAPTNLNFRFWLEVMNFCVGDWIVFDRCQNRVSHYFQQHLRRCIRKRLPSWEPTAIWNLNRLPTTVMMWLGFGLFTRGIEYFDSADVATCERAQWSFSAALAFGFCSVMVSFFGFLPGVGFLQSSPGVRQIHLATHFYHRAERPPSLIYVSDGCVSDSTGLVLLVRRRRQRILLVLGASHSEEEFREVRVAMARVVAEGLGSFYDPEDPRRDVRLALQEYERSAGVEGAERRCRRYVHLGIRYPSEGGDAGAVQIGHLFLLSSRVAQLHEEMTPGPSLTLDEISDGRHPPQKDDSEAPRARRSRCCECGVPPELFSCICRLGHSESKEVVQEISKSSSLRGSWEAKLPSRVTVLRREEHLEASFSTADGA